MDVQPSWRTTRGGFATQFSQPTRIPILLRQLNASSPQIHAAKLASYAVNAHIFLSYKPALLLQLRKT